MDALDFEEFMRALAGGIDELFQEKFGRRIGFAMISFEFGKPGISNYISNADRGDMVKALEETLERWKNNEDIPAVIPKRQ